MAEQTYYCEKCGRTMGDPDFYSSNNTEKYPTGKLNLCKKCLTMHVDNWEPDTYLWILQEIDVPYIPDEWTNLLARYGQNKSKVTGMTILGRYLSKMKLKQYRDYRWKDTDFLQEIAQHKIEEAMKRQGYDAQEIAKAVDSKAMNIPQGEIPIPQYDDDESNPYLASPDEDYFANQSGQDDLGAELTDEDRIYLRLKWGKTYKPEEWIALEKLYNEMMESYDIQSAGHVDTLKLVCKTSLKCNQLIDIGDVEGFQKMSKVYDQLMKSGKFTAAQNKAENGEYVDSVCELIALCEKYGFIARYYTDGPQDKVDRTLQDLQTYTKTLVTEEMNLGNLIENAIKQIQIDKEKEALLDADAADDDEILENELFGEHGEQVLKDSDFLDFSDLEEEDEAADDKYLQSLLDEGILQ